MALTSEYQPIIYVAAGSIATFSYPFTGISENYVKAIVRRLDGVIETRPYSVGKNADGTLKGNITFANAPIAGETIMIYRDTTDTQETPFSTLQGYNAKALELILDKIVALAQENKDIPNQVLKLADMQRGITLDRITEVDDEGLLYFSFADKKIKATELKESDLVNIITKAILSNNETVKNMSWNGNVLTITLKTGASQQTKKGVISDNVAQVRMITNPAGNLIFQYSLNGIDWHTVGDQSSNYRYDLTSQINGITKEFNIPADILPESLITVILSGVVLKENEHYVIDVLNHRLTMITSEAPEIGDWMVIIVGDGLNANNGSGIPDAPVDGKIYGRQNAAWVEVLSETSQYITAIMTINNPTYLQNRAYPAGFGVNYEGRGYSAINDIPFPAGAFDPTKWAPEPNSGNVGDNFTAFNSFIVRDGFGWFRHEDGILTQAAADACAANNEALALSLGWHKLYGWAGSGKWQVIYDKNDGYRQYWFPVWNEGQENRVAVHNAWIPKNLNYIDRPIVNLPDKVVVDGIELTNAHYREVPLWEVNYITGKIRQQRGLTGKLLYQRLYEFDLSWHPDGTYAYPTYPIVIDDDFTPDNNFFIMGIPSGSYLVDNGDKPANYPLPYFKFDINSQTAAMTAEEIYNVRQGNSGLEFIITRNGESEFQGVIRIDFHKNEQATD